MTEALGESVATGGQQQLFDALLSLDERFRDNAVGLPQRQALHEIWSGVLFRIGELSLLAPLDEVSEIRNVPRAITPVPATKDWVFGIANNRGTLLPMFDLRGFLFGSPKSPSAKSRVLVVRRDEFPVGLLVDEVSGIRHFDEKPQSQRISDLPDTLAPFVLGSCKLGTDLLYVFSVRRLTRDAGFNLTGV